MYCLLKERKKWESFKSFCFWSKHFISNLCDVIGVKKFVIKKSISSLSIYLSIYVNIHIIQLNLPNINIQ